MGGIFSRSSQVSLRRRIGAIVYDWLLIAALLFFASVPVTLWHGEALRGEWWYRIYLLLIVFLFFGWFWTHGGQTLGMRAWRIGLVSEDGTRVGWRQCLVRCAAALMSWAALGLGFWWALWDPRGRTWHDRASRTRLVYRERP